MRSCRRLSSCLLLQAVLVAQGPEILSSVFFGPSAYDPVRGRVVRALSDGTTWEWDGAWFRSLAGAPDLGTGGFDMVFDPARRQVLLCKLLSASGSLFGYDGTRWTQLPMPAGQLPLNLVHDTGRARLVLMTVDTTTQTLTSTFEDSGGGWVAVNTATRVPFGFPPPPRTATYDPLTARTMVVTSGGLNGMAAVWSYDGINWSLLAAGGPPLQSGASLAFDPTRGVVVMHGGLVGFAFSSDVWEWNGTLWTNRGSGAGAILQTSNSSLVFDTAHGRLLGVGGFFNNAYVAQWDGAAWTILDRPAQIPGARLAYDLLHDATVALVPGQTSEWRDARWVLGSLPQPPIEQMFFDLARGAVVGVSLAQLPGAWTWNGSNWNPLPASSSFPPPRINYALSFDLLVARATLFGGANGTVVLGDTWQWDGISWTQLQPAASPPPRHRAHMVRDVAGARSLLAGGQAATAVNTPWLLDVWSFDGATWQQVSAGNPWMAEGQVDLVYDDLANRILAVSSASSVFEVRALVPTGWQLLSSNVSTAGVSSAVFESRRGTILASGLGLARVPIHPALVSSTGTGCGAPLRLSARTWPRAGEPNFGFDVSGVVGAALVAVSAGTANTPLGGNCTALLPSIDLEVLVIANAAGFGQALVPIPDFPLFRGLAVHAQAAQLDPTSPIGVGLSARLDIVVGD